MTPGHIATANTKPWAARSSTRKHARRPAATRIARSIALAFGSLLLGTSALAQLGSNALPTQGKVVAGSASIASKGNAMTITQGTARAAIDWSTFDIGSAASVMFLQPSSSSVALNRVLSGSASEIAGRLSANGKVYLVNPAGVLFSSTAQVNVGGLVASTLGMSSADFMAGSTTFDGAGSGRIANEGSISAANGYIAFIASDIANTGKLQANGGSVALAAGDRVTLRMAGDSLMDFSVDRSALQTMVDNRGAIIADGGQVLVGARAVGDLTASVINNSGLIEANSLQNVNGVIRLSGAHGLQNDGQIVAAGGSISTQSTNLLQQGVVDAADVALRASGSVLHSGITRANASMGGSVLIEGGKNADNGDGVYLSGTVQANGSSGQGGRVAIAGASLTLAGVSIEATGAQAGGSVTVGKGLDASGDAQSVNMLPGSRIDVSATDHGDGGTAQLWSTGSTRFGGAIVAQGGKNGGNGGAVEVSGKGLAYVGDVDTSAANGSAGSLLLDPMNINIVSSVTPFSQLTDYFINPHPAGTGFATQVTALASGGTNTGFYTVTAPTDNLLAASAGAVYLFNGSTKALVSTLTGNAASQQVGLGGVTALTNGNFVVASPSSVTWGNGTTGVAGTVSATNSLLGFSTYLGRSTPGMYPPAAVTALSNGNYVVADPYWGGTLGAVAWGNGAGGTVGTVSTSNALVGTGSDYVGSLGVTALSNGNYVVNSPYWNNGTTLKVGAVTWGNGSTGTAGVVSASNSLVGTTANDSVGAGLSSASITSTASNLASYPAIQGVTALANGNYVVRSGNWGNSGSAYNGKGAVTVVDGSNGFTKGAASAGNTISAANSLVGSTAGDRIGSHGVTLLANGGVGTNNFVIDSPYWHNGAVVNAGAVTWSQGTPATATVGAVSSSNSLAGTATNDAVGSRFYSCPSGCNGPYVGLYDYTPGGVTALTNGNYVVTSANWNASMGAATWVNGSTGQTKNSLNAISSANSWVGDSSSGASLNGDNIGLNGVTALSNGNYVVDSSLWGPGAVAANGHYGAVTWGDGAAGSAGTVSALNSLVGSAYGDQVGRGAVTWSTSDPFTESGVLALNNGNYIVRSPRWGAAGGTWAGSKGAVTWGNGAGGTVGAVSAANSLVGSVIGDDVGYDGVTVLPNGNAVVASSYWSGSKGAVSLMSGTAATVGAVSVANSLAGVSANDRVGSGGVTVLGNGGNYVVASPQWINGGVYQGAVTWSNGSSPASSTVGSISAANSLVGYALPAYAAGVQFGSGGVVAAPNGDYAVLTNFISGVTYSSVAAGGTATTGGTGVANPQGMIFGTNATMANLGNFTGVNGYSVGSNSFFSAALTKQVVGLGSGIYSGGTQFATLPFATVDLVASNLASTLTGGTAVTLQANNDINVNAAITEGAGAGHGTLTLQAGRNVNINANISTGGGALSITANETAANGMISNSGYHRQAGTGGITMATGTALDSGSGAMSLTVNNGTNSGTLEVRALTGGAITLTNSGAQAGSKIVVDGAVNGASISATDLVGTGGITINAGGSLTGTGTGNAIVLRTAGTAASTGFVNNAGASALSATNASGRWLVYGTTPVDDVRGMTVDGSSIFKRYNCSYLASGGCANAGAPSVPATGSGFLYSVAPNLTLTATGSSTSVYGNAVTFSNNNITFTGSSGYIDGDTSATAPLTGTPTFSTAATSTSNVGSYGITYTGGMGSVLGYGITNSVSGLNHTITARPLTVVLNSVNKTYDGSVAAGGVAPCSLTSATCSLLNIANGDAVFVGGALSGQVNGGPGYYVAQTGVSTSFADKNVGTGKALSLSLGVASLVPSANVIANPGGWGVGSYWVRNNNYTVAAIDATATGIITARPLTVTPSASSKVYDGSTLATVSLSDNRVLNDVLTVASTSATFNNKNVGTAKPVTIAGVSLSGTDALNYSLAGTTLSTAANITARPITITGVTASDKVYDGNATATINGGVFSNFVAGDVVTVGGLTGAFNNANAANGKTVTVTGAATFTGADAGNYTITGASPATTTANITPKPLTVTLTPANKVYDGLTAAASNNYTLSGAVAGESVGLSNGALTPYQYNTGFGFTTLYGLTAVPTSFGDKNVANGKTITLDPAPATLVLAYSSLFNGAAQTWSGTGNYTVGTVVNSTGNITPRSVSLTGTRTYDTGTTANASILSVANLVAGDGLSLSGSATLASKNAGAEAISSMGSLALGGVDVNNYTLTGGSGSVTVNQAALTVAAPTVSKVYDAGTSASGAPTLVSGLLAGDTFNGGTLAFADKNVGAGNKTVNVGSVSIGDGNSGANYAVTKQANTLSTISAYNLSATVAAASKAYDGATSATLTGASLSGVFAADAGTVSTDATTLTGAFVDKDAANGKTVNLTGALALGGANAGNYTVSTPSTTTANITPKGVTLTGVTASNKVYDGTTTASITGTPGLSGVLPGESLNLNSGAVTANFVDRNVGNAKSVNVSGVTLANSATGLASNYSLNSGSTTATANITALNLTAAVTAANKVYDGTTNASLSGANLSGVLAIDAGTVGTSASTLSGAFADKNVANGKTVNLTGTLALSGANAGNYTVTTPGTSTANISALNLTATVATANKVYDGNSNASLTGATLSGVLAADAASVGTSASTLSGAFVDKNAANGKTVNLTGTLALSGASAVNYTVTTPTTSSADITARSLIVTPSASNKVYDASTAASITAVADNRIAGDVLAVAYTNATFSDKNVANGKTVTLNGVSLSGADAGNYSVTAPSTTTANISAYNLSATVAAANKAYDGATSATLTGASLSGVFAADAGTVSTDATTLTGAFVDKDAANGKTVNLTGALALGGANAGNYTVSTPSTTTANITPKGVTLTGVTASNKVYDGTTTASITGTPGLSGVLPGESLNLNSGAVTANFVDRNVGNAKSVNVSGVTLANSATGLASNYSLNSGSTTATANITALNLTAAVTAANKVYDGNTNASLSGANLSGVLAIDAGTVGTSASTLSGTFADKNVANGKTVNLTGTLALSGANAGNYTVTTPGTSTADITPRTVSLTGARTYDTGTTANASILSVTNLVAGDGLSLSGSATLASKNAGAEAISSMGSLALGGADVNNYTLTGGSGSVTVNQAALTVAAPTVSKVYDAGTSASGAPTLVSGLLAGDTFNGGTLAFADKNVGAGNKTVNVGSVSISDGNSGANYAVTKQANTLSTISAYNLSATVAAADKAYDGATNATLTGASLSGVFAADAGTVSTDATTLTGAFVDKDAANGKTVNLTGALALGGANAGNYTVSTPSTTTANITPKGVTLTGVTASNKVYDGTTTATITGTPGLSGVLPGESLNLNSGAVTANFVDRNVGNAKSVNVSGVTLANSATGLASNYSLNSGSTTATANITPLNLTATVVAANKTYDGGTAVTLTGANLPGVFAVDAGTVGANLGAMSGAFVDKNVANGKTVNLTGTLALSGANAGNYTVTTPGTSTADITARNLNVTATALNKVYDATTAATITAIADNRIAGDVLTVAYSGGTFSDKNVGVAKTVTLSGVGLSGTDAGNYNVATPSTTTADITARNLNVTPTAANKVYDATTAASITSTADNRIAGDVLTVGYANATFSDKNVGVAKTVTLSGVGLSGIDAGNYSVATPSTTTADITARNLNVTATAANKVYDATTAASITSTADNRMAGDVLTVAYSGGTFSDKNVGVAKTVTLSGVSLSGSDAGNYAVLSPSTTKADITARNLNVTPTAANKVYDATTAATITAIADNRISGDVLTVAYSGGTFSDKNVGVAKTVTLSGVSLSGSDAGNYAVLNPSTTKADITARNLEVTATAANKVYDATTAATITATADNRMAGDVLTLAYSGGTFSDKNVGVAKTVTLSGVSLSGSDAGNYAVLSPSTTKANITTRDLTVVADDASKLLGQPNPVFTATVTGLAPGDSLTTLGVLQFTSSAELSSPVGSYAIVPGGLSSGNYASHYVNGALTVRSLTNSVPQAGVVALGSGQGNERLSDGEGAGCGGRRGSFFAFFDSNNCLPDTRMQPMQTIQATEISIVDGGQKLPMGIELSQKQRTLQ